MTAPLTPAELAAITQRLADASPLPWTEDDGNIFSGPLSDERAAAMRRRLLDGSTEPHPDAARDDGYPMGFVASCGQGGPYSENDTELIVAAVNALPRLLADRARREEEMAQAVAKERERLAKVICGGCRDGFNPEKRTRHRYRELGAHELPCHAADIWLCSPEGAGCSTGPCCERDHDGDGNCDRHPSTPAAAEGTTTP